MVGAQQVADVSPSACMRCVEVVLEDPWWAVQDVLGGIPGVLLGGVTTLVIYLARKRGETKALARRFAKSIRREIERIQGLLDNTTQTDIRIRPLAAVDRLPTDIYDGLLNSAAISNFDIDLQDGLYNFYKLFRDKPADEISVSEETLRVEAIRISDRLDRYIRRNRPRLKFF